MSHEPQAALADALNRGCHCRTIDAEALQRHLESSAHLAGLAQTIARTRPHLFSSTAVFITPTVEAQIRQAVALLHRVMSLPAFEAQALVRAPAIARHRFGPQGMFMGYDFHIEASGPRLIEINTNAGGAFLNAVLASAQQSCCAAVAPFMATASVLHSLNEQFFGMFLHEWQLQRGDRTLGRVAIVDDTPEEQYLAPEFELCRQLLEDRGVPASIVPSEGLQWRDGRLWAGDNAVDMVYNRLTDFYLSDPAHQALRLAYKAGAVVLSPHPRAHAVHAGKRNLVVLGNSEQLAAWGVSADDRQLLQTTVPETLEVTPARADAFWAQRRHWFFKPDTGFGGKAVYRGDKLTRRVWDGIVQGGYVAQAVVPPGERQIEVDGVRTDLKFDLRAYAYEGRVQLLAARMYAGQTTNFRTPGGGFAPVVLVP